MLYYYIYLHARKLKNTFCFFAFININNGEKEKEHGAREGDYLKKIGPSVASAEVYNSVPRTSTAPIP